MQSDTMRFYESIAAAAARHGYLSLYILRCAGRPVAALLALVYRGRCFAAKIAHDEGYRQYAPGHLLVGAVVRDCARRGCTEFDFLGHTQEWKQRWTKSYHTVYSVTIIRPNLIGRALLAARRLRRRLTRAGAGQQMNTDAHRSL